MRRLRYEEAGQRFLEGKFPSLLSASLRGPFDSWRNPWRSKQRCESRRASESVCGSVLTQATHIPDSLAEDNECHLPSPESLKQTPISEPHAYLMQCELAINHSGQQDGSLTKKRQTNNRHDLPKRVAKKKRRTNTHGPCLSTSPFVSSQSGPSSSSVAIIDGHSASTARALPEAQYHAISSSHNSRSSHRPEIKIDPCVGKDGNDQLVNTQVAAFDGISQRSMLGTKRHTFLGHNSWKSAILHASIPADEVNQDNAAAVMLTSPISQHHEMSPIILKNRDRSAERHGAIVEIETGDKIPPCTETEISHRDPADLPFQEKNHHWNRLIALDKAAMNDSANARCDSHNVAALAKPRDSPISQRLSPVLASEMEHATVASISEQGHIADKQVPNEDMGANRMDAQDLSHKSWTAVSQQSPWSKSQQDAHPGGFVSGYGGHVSSSTSSQLGAMSLSRVLPEAQSPWSREAVLSATIKTEPDGAEASASIDGHAGNAWKPQPHPRKSTPEPLFSIRTFASFLSPSPKRIRRRKEPSLSHIGHPSAMKNPLGPSRPVRRISWVPMSQDQHVTSDVKSTECHETPSLSPRPQKPRKASPPPAHPVEDMSVFELSRFGKHFAAVVGRADSPRERLIPTASQQALQSPGMQAMARTFLAADEVWPGGPRASTVTSTVVGSIDEGPQGDNDSVDGKSDKSEEPMELAEDMLREIANFVNSWNVDAELDDTRRAAKAQD